MGDLKPEIRMGRGDGDAPGPKSDSSQNLILVLGGENERAVPLCGDAKFTLGRGLSNSFVVADKKVSRKHCFFQDGYLHDVSVNGTYLNGRRLERWGLGENGNHYALNDGDEIKVGKTVLSVKASTQCPSSASARCLDSALELLSVDSRLTTAAMTSVAGVPAAEAEERKHLRPENFATAAASDPNEQRLAAMESGLRECAERVALLDRKMAEKDELAGDGRRQKQIARLEGQIVDLKQLVEDMSRRHAAHILSLERKIENLTFELKGGGRFWRPQARSLSEASDSDAAADGPGQEKGGSVKNADNLNYPPYEADNGSAASSPTVVESDVEHAKAGSEYKLSEVHNTSDLALERPDTLKGPEGGGGDDGKLSYNSTADAVRTLQAVLERHEVQLTKELVCILTRLPEQVIFEVVSRVVGALGRNEFHCLDRDKAMGQLRDIISICKDENELANRYKPYGIYPVLVPQEWDSNSRQPQQIQPQQRQPQQRQSKQRQPRRFDVREGLEMRHENAHRRRSQSKRAQFQPLDRNRFLEDSGNCYQMHNMGDFKCSGPDADLYRKPTLVSDFREQLHPALFYVLNKWVLKVCRGHMNPYFGYILAVGLQGLSMTIATQNRSTNQALITVAIQSIFIERQRRAGLALSARSSAGPRERDVHRSPCVVIVSDLAGSKDLEHRFKDFASKIFEESGDTFGILSPSHRAFRAVDVAIFSLRRLVDELRKGKLNLQNAHTCIVTRAERLIRNDPYIWKHLRDCLGDETRTIVQSYNDGEAINRFVNKSKAENSIRVVLSRLPRHLSKQKNMRKC